MASDPKRHHLGGRIGPRIADLTARAMTAHLRQSGDTRARIHAAGLDRFWHQVGDEYRQAMGPELARLADHPEMPDPLRPLFRFMATQPGEGAAMLSALYYGTGLGQTVGAILSNYLAPIVHGDLKAAPNALLPPDLLARLVAMGIYAHEPAGSDAAGSGIAGWRFDQMVEGATTYPDFATALELRRRQIAGTGDLYKYLRRAGYPDREVSYLDQLTRQVLQPADLALMVLRGIIDQQDGRAIAAQSGVDAQDFDRLTLATGEPLGLDQLLEAYRRGFIDQPRLVRGIRQSRVRNEWVDVAERLRFEPMDTADAVRAVVQNELADADGKRIAEQNGLEPDHWDTVVKAYGNPIAVGQALELLNRGEMSTARVEQVVRESRTKNKYVGDVVKLRRRLPPERSVVMMLAHGAIDHAHAVRLLLELGYDQQVAEAFVKTGAAQRTQQQKHLTATEVTTLYAEGAIQEAEAITTLEHLHYSHSDARLLLRMAVLRQEATFRRQAANRIGTDYVDRLIDRQAVDGYLAHVGLPRSQIDQLLTLWDLERGARRRHLTEAQIHAAAKAGVITVGDAHARLVAMGYAPGDATILLAGL